MKDGTRTVRATAAGRRFSTGIVPVRKVEHIERARSGMTGAGYYRATCWVPSEAGLRARFVAMVERLREATEGSPRDRAEMEARG